MNEHRKRLFALCILSCPFVAIGQKPVDLTRPSLYVTSYSHLDTEWCWTYRESILDYIPNTIRENLDLLDRHPSYVFNWTGAARYKILEEYYPAEFARLKKAILEGRWVPMGSTWDECDVVVPGPESIIRQILYSNQYFQERFGKTSNQFFLPDAFGFPASLPTLLSHCGLVGFSTKKLNYGAGCAVGIPFNVGKWVGPDGSYVYSVFNPGDYRTRISKDLSNDANWLKRLKDNGAASGVFADYMYHGNGDEGGSPGEKSVSWLDSSLSGTGPVRVVGGSADQFFSDLVEAKSNGLPSYQGDLLLIQHSAGSINSNAHGKLWNREAEALAKSAESAAVSAELWVGQTYPASSLREGWQRLLNSQMHDILPGTSIPKATQYGWNDQAIARNLFTDVLRSSVQAVADQMDTTGEGRTVVVFNPSSFDREDSVEVAVDLGAGGIAVGPDGKRIALQRLGNHRSTFMASVPANGFAAFRLVKSPVRAIAGTSRKGVLENRRFLVRVGPTGDIIEFYDKEAKRGLLSAPIRLAFLHEKPQRHPAWNMDWEDRQKPPVGYVDGPATIQAVENGPVYSSVRVTRNARGSRFSQQIRLYSDRLEFIDDIDWRSQECSLKAVFPLAIRSPKTTYSWGVGTVERGVNDPKKYEVPTHDWLDQSADGYGISLLTHAKFGSDKPDENTLRLTLLYTPGVKDSFQHQAWQDWGHHQIRYALVPHKGDWREAMAPTLGEAFNVPLVAVEVPKHAGRLGKSIRGMSSSSSSVNVLTVKKAEDGKGLIARVVEQRGSTAPNVNLQLGAQPVSFVEVDGQEKMLSAAPLRSFSLRPYQVRAFYVKPALNVGKRHRFETVPLHYDIDAVSEKFGTSSGNLDGDGRSIPGELLPGELISGGVPFRLGSRGSSGMNAMQSDGQTLRFPAGARKLSLLAVSKSKDQFVTWTFGRRALKGIVQSWRGFVGQGDVRTWDKPEPATANAWPLKCVGVRPGYEKAQPIAWLADHVRLANGANEPYDYGYLFRIDLPLTGTETSLKLPKNRNVVIFAATVSR